MVSAVLAAPEPVVLVVGGAISKPTHGQTSKFSMSELRALPQHSFTTRTPWYDGPRTFTGPLLRDVLQAVGAQGMWIRATALNAYHVDIPVSDAQEHDMLLAHSINDKLLSVRQRGPLFVIYPFDQRPQVRDMVHFDRCIWQLEKLEVR